MIPRAAPLAGPTPIASIGQEVVAVGSKQAPEAALTTVRGREEAAFHEPNEVILRQVGRLLRGVTPRPDERIDRIPVTATELRQGIARAGLPGSEEDKGFEAADAALRTALVLRDIRER